MPETKDRVSVERWTAAQAANRLNAAVHRCMAESRFEEARRLRAKERTERDIARNLTPADPLATVSGI